MKYIFLFLALCALISCQRKEEKKASTVPLRKHQVDTMKSQNTDRDVFDNLESRTLLTRLFDNPVFDSNDVALWKPNFYESSKYNTSVDGKCHTNIDTILYFTDHGKRKCAAAILTTYHYGRDVIDSSISIGDCHFCGVPIGIALLSQREDKKWELYRFEKAFTTLGYFGEYKTHRQDSGVISLKEIGDHWTVLSLREGIGGNMGEMTGYENWYSLEQYLSGGFPEHVLTDIFSYTYYYSYDSNMNDHPQVLETADVKFTKKKDDYYGIDLISTKSGKRNTTHYIFSEEDNVYVEQKDSLPRDSLK